MVRHGKRVGRILPPLGWRLGGALRGLRSGQSEDFEIGCDVIFPAEPCPHWRSAPISHLAFPLARSRRDEVLIAWCRTVLPAVGFCRKGDIDDRAGGARFDIDPPMVVEDSPFHDR
jgi:hypothetical protein